MQNRAQRRGIRRFQAPQGDYILALKVTRVISLVALILSAAPLGLAQNPPTAKLVEIKVTGSERYSQADLVRATELVLGTMVNPAAFQEAANRLSASGAFSKVEFSYSDKDGGAAVEFRVADGSGFGRCTFDNIVWFPEKELRVRIKEMVPLFGDQIPLKGDIPAKVEAILAHLLEEKEIPGTITILGAGESGVSAVQFSVAGVRLIIQQIELQGAKSLNPAPLSAALQPLLGTNYDPKVVREYVAQIIGSAYERQGYLKQSFSAPTATLLPGSMQDVMVTVAVSEGDQFRLKEVRWQGNQAVASEELNKLLHVLPNQPADLPLLEQNLADVQALYADKGYIDAQWSSQPELDDATKLVTVSVTIREGDLYSMGKLEIAGIDPERAEALRKTSELAPGQPYNRAYWNTFISKSGRLLPSSRTPWKAIPKENVHADTKTVDVTLTFAANAEP